jgi:hypothetical protein
MIYICYIKYRNYLVTYVLAVGDGELTVGDNDDASSGVAEVRHVQEAQKLTWTTQWHDPASRFQASGKGWGFLQAVSVNKVCNFNFHRYIRILLIITNPMIYICYIKYWNNVVICVLTVGDDELGV